MKIINWLRDEFFELLPAIIYFFVAFSILIINERLILDQPSFSAMNFFRPLIGALLVAKILLVVNLLPVINLFQGRPLIWNTLWKASLYWVFGLLFQAGESLVDFLIEGQGSALQQTLEEITTSRFIAVQMWLFILLLLFVGIQQLASALGAAKVRELFLGAERA